MLKHHLLVILFLLPLTARAQSPLSPADLARLGAELGSDQFQVRQRATQELLAAGPAAAEVLIAAAREGDAEIRSRAIRVLVDQALTTDDDRRHVARQTLEALSAAPEPLVARAARGALDDLREINVALAAAELTRLNATVMPQENTNPIRYAVQIRQSWLGGDDKLQLLTDLGGVPWLSLENAPVTDAGLPHIARLTDLERLYLGSSKITGRELRRLAPLKNLKYLSFKQLPLDDQSLAELPDFPGLQYLGLDYTNISDAGLAQLARYPALQTLWLDYTKITDVGLARLKPLAQLRTLFIPGTLATGPALAELRHMPNLSYLSLKEAKLEADTLKHIAQIEQLETLGLDHTNVTDDQLADLAGLMQLRILWLSKTQITDAGLMHLKELRNLQVVYLHGSEVTAEGAEELRKALPNCHIAR